MAKIVKKIEKKTKIIGNLNKTKQKFKKASVFKNLSLNSDCFVKLQRLSKREIEFYTKTDVVSKTFDLKVTKDMNLTIKKRGSELQLMIVEPQFIQNKSEATIVLSIEPKPLAKNLTTLINDAWKASKKHKNVMQIGDLVMAKMRSYSPWPGRFDGYTTNKKKAHIHFFGSNNNGSVESSEIVSFEHCESMIRLLLLRKTGEFHKGISEIECILNIPPHLSLLREQESLK